MTHQTIIDADTLARERAHGRWVVVDCRFELGNPDAGRAAWQKATIPGAVFADLDRDLSAPVQPGVTGRHPLPDPDELAVTLGRLGIDENTQVVAFDDAGGAFAARLWWLLRWLGHDDVAVLDGGFSAWVSAGLTTAPGQADVPSAYFVPRPRRELAVGAETVRSAQADPAVAILDARAAARYRGENETTDPVAGHIPGAKNAPFAANLDDSGRMKSPEDLRRHYEAILGDRDSSNAIVYCGSGVTACHDILAITHAGLAAPRLYAGSWSEWITDPTRPVATGDDAQ